MGFETKNYNDVNEVEKKEKFGEFLDDFPNIREKVENNNPSNLDMDVYFELGQNYIDIKTGDKEKDLNNAINISYNKILIKYKNLPKNQDTYKNAEIMLSSSDIYTRLDGLKTLYAIATSKEGISSLKQTKEYIDGKLKIKEETGVNITNFAKELINMQLEKQTENKKNEEEITKSNIKPEVKEGEIFSGDKNEVIKNSEPLNNEIA